MLKKICHCANVRKVAGYIPELAPQALIFFKKNKVTKKKISTLCTDYDVVFFVNRANQNIRLHQINETVVLPNVLNRSLSGNSGRNNQHTRGLHCPGGSFARGVHLTPKPEPHPCINSCMIHAWKRSTCWQQSRTKKAECADNNLQLLLKRLRQNYGSFVTSLARLCNQNMLNCSLVHHQRGKKYNSAEKLARGKKSGEA